MSIANSLAGALAKQKVQSDEIRDIGCYLSTGIPNVDRIISGKYRGGGFKSARMVEIASPASAGKTLIAQHVIKEAQKAGGAGAFHDHEKTFVPNLFERFGGSIEPGIWTYKRPDTFEESLDQAVDWMQAIREADVIPFEAPLVCVFDSLAAMVPHAEITRNRSESKNMKEKLALATATSQEFPAFNHFIEKNNILAIFLNQMRVSPGAMGKDPRYTPGGEAPFFYDAVKMYLGRTVKKDANGNVIGQTVRAETVKNKTYRHGLKTSFEFKYNDDGTGFIDVIESMLMHLKDIGKLEMSGAYAVWEGKKKYISVLAAEMNQSPEESMEKLIDIAEAAAA